MDERVVDGVRWRPLIEIAKEYGHRTTAPLYTWKKRSVELGIKPVIEIKSFPNSAKSWANVEGVQAFMEASATKLIKSKRGWPRGKSRKPGIVGAAVSRKSQLLAVEVVQEVENLLGPMKADTRARLLELVTDVLERKPMR